MVSVLVILQMCILSSQRGQISVSMSEAFSSFIWAAARQNQQNKTCLIRPVWLIFFMWTDKTDRLGGSQADPSLRWAHRSVCWFCYVVAHILCERKAKALARLHGRAGTPEPSLFAHVISTLFTWADSMELFTFCTKLMCRIVNSQKKWPIFSEYTDFLEDLEEDPQYRENVNIYKG